MQGRPSQGVVVGGVEAGVKGLMQLEGPHTQRRVVGGVEGPRSQRGVVGGVEAHHLQRLRRKRFLP